MKNLELSLKGHIVIIEIPEGAEYQITSKIFALTLPSGNIELLKKKLELICGKDELNEEIADSLVFRSKIGTYKNYDHKIRVADSLMDALLEMKFKTATESFISAIEAQGYYWGENPIEKEVDSLTSDNTANGCAKYRKAFHEWQEAEEKTFSPENCIICRVLE